LTIIKLFALIACGTVSQNQNTANEQALLGSLANVHT